MSGEELIMTTNVSINSSISVSWDAARYDNKTKNMENIIRFGEVYAVIDIILLPFIVIGNLLVLISILTDKRLQNITNMFVASLAVADLLVGLITIPLYAVFDLRFDDVMHNKYLCFMRYAFVINTCGSSLSNLTFVTAERYIAIFFPLRYDSLVTPGRAKLTIALLWSYMTIISLLPTFGWNSWKEGMMCDFYQVFPYGYTLLSAFILAGLCLLLTTVMYTRILSKARQHRAAMKAHVVRFNVKERKTFKAETDSVNVMAVVFFLFVAFWLPYLTIGPLKYASTLPADVIEVIKNFCLSLGMSNSLVNPIVYCGMRRDFRVAFKRIMYKFLCRKTKIGSFSFEFNY